MERYKCDCGKRFDSKREFDAHMEKNRGHKGRKITRSLDSGPSIFDTFTAKVSEDDEEELEQEK